MHICNKLKEIIGTGYSEGKDGLWERAQKIKIDYHEEFLRDPTVERELNEDPRNKILVVTHPNLMNALTSKAMCIDPHDNKNVML